MIVRRLNYLDFDQIRQLVLENQTFQRSPVSDSFKKMVIDITENHLIMDATKCLYYGTLDAEDRLLCWSYWRLWDEDGSVSFSSIYSTNSVIMEKADGSNRSTSVVEMTNRALRDLHALGRDRVYALAPVTGWTGWKDEEGSEFRNYDCTMMGVLRANDPTTNPQWNKYLAAYEITTMHVSPVPIKVVMFTRKVSS